MLRLLACICTQAALNTEPDSCPPEVNHLYAVDHPAGYVLALHANSHQSVTCAMPHLFMLCKLVK